MGEWGRVLAQVQCGGRGGTRVASQRLGTAAGQEGLEWGQGSPYVLDFALHSRQPH